MINTICTKPKLNPCSCVVSLMWDAVCSTAREYERRMGVFAVMAWWLSVYGVRHFPFATRRMQFSSRDTLIYCYSIRSLSFRLAIPINF